MTQLEPATSRLDLEATEVGSVFVSNYPPYSFWSAHGIADAYKALEAPPREGVSLGLYLHIPFCRKRCKFCYFRVFTDKNSEQITAYLDAVATEMERAAAKPAIAGRPLDFVYFGGGTPSYIAAKQLVPFVERLKAALPWDHAREVAFECEPGTLTQSKVAAIRSIGVTRLSLGIEHFNDDVLQRNGRAHLAQEIYRVRDWIRAEGFDQLNIDLIAGMVGDTWERWRETVDRAIAYEPDSVTIYQMELPYNTVFSQGKLRGEGDEEFADWATKRAWHQYAIDRFLENGFETSSAYTVVKKRGAKVGSSAGVAQREADRANPRSQFLYRDSVWSGNDLLGIGVSSFSHVNGVHFQNVDGWDDYLRHIANDGAAIGRAFVPTPAERMTREFILQLKKGEVHRQPFVHKFGVDPAERFAEPLGVLAKQGVLRIEKEFVQLSPWALLRVDQLLPNFYDPRYRDARYT